MLWKKQKKELKEKKKRSLVEIIMDSKFDRNTIIFCNGMLKEFMWTKKIKSVNEVNFWR